MLVDVFSESAGHVFDGIVKCSLHVGIRKNRSIVNRGEWLLQGRILLEEVHDFFKLIFRALGGFGFLGVELLEPNFIFSVHAVRTADGVFDCGGEAYVRVGLSKHRRVKSFILDVAELAFGGGDENFLG